MKNVVMITLVMLSLGIPIAEAYKHLSPCPPWCFNPIPEPEVVWYEAPPTQYVIPQQEHGPFCDMRHLM